MLPGTSGLDLARRWRKETLTREVPIIMLTARGEENDRVGARRRRETTRTAAWRSARHRWRGASRIRQ